MFNNNEFVNINSIVNRFSEELNSVSSSVEEIDSTNLNELSNEEKVVLLLSKFDDIRQFNRYWKGYINSYKFAVEKDVSSRDNKINELEQERIKIKEENRQLRKQIDKLEQERIKMINEFYDRLESVDTILDMVNNNIGFFRNQKEIKETSKKDRHGVNAPAYRKDVDGDAIRLDFANGMSISELAKKYGMTYQGMKHRVDKFRGTLGIRGGNE